MVAICSRRGPSRWHRTARSWAASSTATVAWRPPRPGGLPSPLSVLAAKVGVCSSVCLWVLERPVATVPGRTMRVAFAGKGGSGKTTLAATLARVFARRGYRVNALDDDPNPNLGVALGLTADQLATLRRVPRDEIIEERVDSDG